MRIKSEGSLFDPSFIAEKMNEFPISEEDLKHKRGIVRSWIDELKSGKLESLKEESIKGRFIHDFFDRILGFISNHPSQWGLTPELKSFVDGKKPDAALGEFQLYANNGSSQVAAVVEIKDANTDLDKKIDCISPVDQAFGYAPRTKAAWVFVSNFKEIRFYESRYIGKYQKFELKTLDQDKNLKAFILLCACSALVHPVKARTAQFLELPQGNNSKKFANKKQHIVDELYKTLKAFDGIGFIDPNTLANIYPFNILDDYVWHYENFALFTLNPEIYALLTEVELNNGEVQLSPALQQELKKQKVTKVEEKLNFIFKKLNYSNVFHLAGVKDYGAIAARNKYPSVIGFSVRHFFRFSKESDQGIHMSIRLASQSCDCLSCNFRSLDLKKMLKKLKDPHEDITTYELGYGNYLVSANGYKTAYQNYTEVIKTWRQTKHNSLVAYLAHYNLVALFNLLNSYEEEHQNKLSKNVKALDLERILWEDLHGLSKDVKKVLRDIRDSTLPERVRKKVDEIFENLQATKKHYDNGGHYSAIANYTHELYHQYSLLYTYVNRNFLVADAYTDYQNIILKIFGGLLISYNLMQYPYRLKSFDNFILSEAVLHIPTQKLEELLKETEGIQAENETLKDFQERLVNFLSSFVDDGIFDAHLNPLMQEYLLNYDFREKCGRIFANVFLLLAKVEIQPAEWSPQIENLLIRFLKTEEHLHWYHLDKLGMFLQNKGSLIKPASVVEILKIANAANKYGYNKYQSLIRKCAFALETFYPETKITEKGVIHKAIANGIGESGRPDYKELIYLWQVVDDEGRQLIKKTFNDSLDTYFNGNFYEHLLREKIYSPSENNYFKKYVEFINRAKGKGFTGFKQGHPQFEDFYFYNFASLLNQLDIPSSDERLAVLSGLSEFEKWILNPGAYNYSNFNPQWLSAVWIESLVPKLRTVDALPDILKGYLAQTYDAKIAEIYFNHFVN